VTIIEKRVENILHVIGPNSQLLQIAIHLEGDNRFATRLKCLELSVAKEIQTRIVTKGACTIRKHMDQHVVPLIWIVDLNRVRYWRTSRRSQNHIVHSAVLDLNVVLRMSIDYSIRG
jgi:uncharacterized SAM-dependent methyltransferase